MADLLNTTLNNRYIIQERIGAGGMARVFKARDINLDRWVAIKVLHEHLSEEPSFSERFTREAKLVASLNHPNIVQVYDYSSFERDGIPIFYMVMPLISGETLRAILDRTTRQNIRLPHERTVSIIRDISAALGYAHERSMAHRDIKPGNIIVDDAGRPILTDFGIARMTETTRLTQDSVTTGTPAYMSPEQVNGQPGDARSDLYALAVMFFEMWAGRLPFVDDSPAALIVKHLYAPIPTFQEITGEAAPAMDNFMQRALAKAPNDRFQSAAEFVSALDEAFAGTADAPTALLAPPSPAAFARADQNAIALLRMRQTAIGDSQPAPPSPAQPHDTTQFLRRRFSAGFAVIGVMLVLILVGLAALQRLPPQQSPVQTDPAEPPLAEAADNTLQSGFTANFSITDADRDRFPTNDEQGGVTRRLVDDLEAYRITNANFPSAVTSIVRSDQPYANVTITMIATLEPDSAPDSGYGIIFRYQDEDNYNVFAVDGLGRYSIWVRQNGEWRELERHDNPERWEENEHVMPIGEQNRLRINITDEALTLFVNNQPITQPISETTFSAGDVGIYVAAPDSGIADVLVDLFEVYPLIPAMTEPGRMG